MFYIRTILPAMYEVVTVITPINYILRYPKALKSLNADREVPLDDLDLAILAALFEAKKGLRNKTIMLAICGRYHAPKMARSLDRLQSLDYIVRTAYKRSVYYTITVKGKRVLQTFSQS